MKAARKRLSASFALSALLLCAGPALAQGEGGSFCTTQSAAGRWGYSVTGSNTSGGPDGIVGAGLVDAKGNVTLTQTEVTNGQVRLSRLEGTITVNRDCTATLTGRVYRVRAVGRHSDLGVGVRR